MIKYVLGLILFFSVACKSSELVKSTETVEPRDADAMMVKAYDLVDAGKVIAGEKLFKEVISMAQQEKDQYLEARGLTGLADIYAYDTPLNKDGIKPEKLLNYRLAAQNYEKAATKLMKVKFTKHAALTYYGAAETYKKADDLAKGCELYIKGAKAYDLESQKEQDQLQPEVDAQIGPILKLFKKQNYKIDCSEKSKKNTDSASKKSSSKNKK